MKKILFILGILLIIASLYLVVSTKMDLIKQQENPVTLDPSSYTCPEKAWVDCMPTFYDPNDSNSVKEKQGREFRCSETYLKWAKGNCPNFEGAAY